MPNLTQSAATNDTGTTEPDRPAAPLGFRVVMIAVVTVPFAGLAAALVHLWGGAFDWYYLAIMCGMTAATGAGITIGYNRLFAHQSFKTSRPVTAILAALGSMALEGPVLKWVATHRCHHQHSDEQEDPHSPHTHGKGVLGFLRGLWHSHVGWLFLRDRGDLARYVRDLRRDPLVLWMSRLFPLWAVLGLVVPAALGGLISGTWFGVLLGLIWGGLVRILLVHHVTWSINSVCHIWGTRPFRCHDESRNNLLFGVLGFGEGWHNNHHAFPTSARHGLRWWEIDLSYMIIKAMALCRLAHDVRVAGSARIKSKLL